MIAKRPRIELPIAKTLRSINNDIFLVGLLTIAAKIFKE